MEVFIDCFVEDTVSGERKKTNVAIYTEEVPSRGGLMSAEGV